MALEALLARLEADSVTPVTPAETADVTAKPAPVLACTAVTPVTSPADVTARATLWLLHFPDLDPVAVAFAPERDQAEVLAAYPDALAAEPMREPLPVPIPGDLLALFDACTNAGLYGDDDRAALPAMFALDAEGTRRLIEAMHAEIRSCRRCRHFRRPGLSDGYCVGRDDLPSVYGLLRALPDDKGLRCDAFDRGATR
ncbi:MAG: hypothetical protein M9885_15075 [Burkholderiaceae bacterium]|nr:hypothetical protein [Burkholderiaceae bacterium]